MAVPSFLAISEAGFLAFLRERVMLPAIILPDDAPIIPMAYYTAVSTVVPSLCQVSPLQYMLAVYNLGTDILINWAPDQPKRDEFRKKREEYKISGFVPGVISSSSNAGTAEGLVNPEVMKGLLFSDLQNLKTPWGRAYLGIVDNFGTLWGMS